MGRERDEEGAGEENAEGDSLRKTENESKEEDPE